MLHWTDYRMKEIEELCGYEPFVSMGSGYSEFEYDETPEIVLEQMSFTCSFRLNVALWKKG